LDGEEGGGVGVIAPSNSRVLLWSVLLGAFAIVAFAVVWPMLRERDVTRWKQMVKQDMIQALKAARSEQELRNAVKPYGLLVVCSNSGWLAIGYRDRHGGGIHSVSIAHDSDDRWFHSERHFCGSLSQIPGLHEQLIEAKSLNALAEAKDGQHLVASRQNSADEAGLLALYSAPNLVSAREQLQKIGFTEFKP
jgi:hypothetical protein